MWLCEAKPQEAIVKIGQTLKTRLGIDPKVVLLGFECHNDTMNKSGSTAKSRYQVRILPTLFEVMNNTFFFPGLSTSTENAFFWRIVSSVNCLKQIFFGKTICFISDSSIMKIVQ